MKLSKAQQKVVDLMKEGWSLGFSRGMTGRVWLQEDGLGRGGKIENVNVNTFNSLYMKKIIVIKKESFPSSSYKLSDAYLGADE